MHRKLCSGFVKAVGDPRKLPENALSRVKRVKVGLRMSTSLRVTSQWSARWFQVSEQRWALGKLFISLDTLDAGLGTGTCE